MGHGFAALRQGKALDVASEPGLGLGQAARAAVTRGLNCSSASSPSTQLRCHLCCGRREVLALITQGTVVRAILECLRLPAPAPMIHPARGTPQLF
jgi:hypothetical protein